jgi:hypothetical protein
MLLFLQLYKPKVNCTSSAFWIVLENSLAYNPIYLKDQGNFSSNPHNFSRSLVVFKYHNVLFIYLLFTNFSGIILSVLILTFSEGMMLTAISKQNFHGQTSKMFVSHTLSCPIQIIWTTLLCDIIQGHLFFTCVILSSSISHFKINFGLTFIWHAGIKRMCSRLYQMFLILGLGFTYVISVIILFARNQCFRPI